MNNKKLHNILFLASMLSLSSAFAQTVTVNGQLGTNEAYAVKCLQNNYSQFGDNIEGNITTATQGSELDGAYAKIENNKLYLMLTGNLESNYNKIEIFFDTKAGGQNQLLNNNPAPSEFEDPNKMAGLTFDTGFEADYWMAITNGPETGTPKIAIYFAELPTLGDPNGFADVPVPDIAMDNTGGPYNWTFSGGQVGINNSNIAGVGGAMGQVGPPSNDPSTVTTGVELAIPLAYLGNAIGDIKICAFINGSGHDFLSNQVLCGLGGNANNLAKPDTVNFNNYPDDQFFVVSPSIGIENPFPIGTISVYPQPAHDQFHVLLHAATHSALYTSISLCDIQGKEIQNYMLPTQVGKNDFEINTHSLPAGIYVLTIQNGNYIYKEKMVISQ